MQNAMAFGSARWCWKFSETPWSNKSDVIPPEGETHESCCLAAQLVKAKQWSMKKLLKPILIFVLNC